MLEKIKNLFKRIKEAFKKLFKKEATPVATPPTESIVEPSRPSSGDVFTNTPSAIDIAEFRGKPVFYLMQKMGRGLTPAEEALARKLGVVFTDPAPSEGAVDFSGNDISDGGVRIFVLEDHQAQTVIFDKPGIVTVFGSSGTHLKTVRDWETRKGAGTVAAFSRVFTVAGTYTFSVTSVGKNIAVQFRPK